MVRSYWMGPLFGVLALTGLAQSQTITPAAPAKASDSKDRYVTVGDLGKPGQKCRVLKTWTTPNGNPAYQVQALDTGELMTIEESESAAKQSPGAVVRSGPTRIFPWGRGARTSPHGSPEPPANAVVLAQPFELHSKTTEPPLAAAAPEKAHGKWPAAFVTKKSDDTALAVTEKRPPAVVKTLQPVAPPMVKNVELTPLRPTPMVPKPAPAAAATVFPNKSPYNPSDAPTPVVKATKSKPANSNSWSAATTWKPWAPSQPPVNSPNPSAAKTPTTVTGKAETTIAPPSDWRESWGKIPPPKPAPVHIEERVTTKAAPQVQLPHAVVKTEPKVELPHAVVKTKPKVELPHAVVKTKPKVELPHAVVKTEPKVELPHAVVKTDDPLRTPEKFAVMPKVSDAEALGSAKETKRPFLALFASNPPAPAPKTEEKKPERPAATIPPPPPVPVAPAAALAVPTVKIPAPTPAQLTPPAAAKASLPAPAKPAPVAVEVKPEAKPTMPLGMRSVLAAQSPELAPPAAKKPAGASQAQAMGIDANEDNAFTEPRVGEKAAVASNGFWGSKKPAPAANAQPDAMAYRAMTPPVGSAQAPLPPSVAVPVSQAEYRQEISPELSQLSVMMHESVYPSQREWMADRLASFDWRWQPQALELLMEGAKQDPAPTVRAECLRSLGRMKCDAPGVVETIKSCRSDADARVRQEADAALAKLTAPSH